MKTLSSLLLLFVSTFSVAQEIVSLDSISKYEGKIITLCETITGTHQTKTDSKVTYLNFGNPYPNHAFTVVIFKGDLQNFSYDPLTLKGKKICITGTVAFYKGKPQIIARKEGDIVIQ